MAKKNLKHLCLDYLMPIKFIILTFKNYLKMDRRQLYAQLVGKEDLKNEIKALFGKPFTNVSTSELENFLNSKKESARHKRPTSKPQPKKKNCNCMPGADHDIDMPHTLKVHTNLNMQIAIASIAIKLEKLINMLSKRGILLEEELNELNECYKAF